MLGFVSKLLQGPYKTTHSRGIFFFDALYIYFVIPTVIFFEALHIFLSLTPMKIMKLHVCVFVAWFSARGFLWFSHDFAVGHHADRKQ
jgi:hypothetical protein